MSFFGIFGGSGNNDSEGNEKLKAHLKKCAGLGERPPPYKCPKETKNPCDDPLKDESGCSKQNPKCEDEGPVMLKPHIPVCNVPPTATFQCPKSDCCPPPPETKICPPPPEPKDCPPPESKDCPPPEKNDCLTLEQQCSPPPEPKCPPPEKKDSLSAEPEPACPPEPNCSPPPPKNGACSSIGNNNCEPKPLKY